MPRTAAVDRPDFHAWRAYQAVVNAETATEQVAVFQFHREGRGCAGVWIYDCLTDGIRIASVNTTYVEFNDPAAGALRRRRCYTAAADALLATGTINPAPPTVHGLDARTAAAALLYRRWIERRGRHRPAALSAERSSGDRQGRQAPGSVARWNLRLPTAEDGRL